MSTSEEEVSDLLIWKSEYFPVSLDLAKKLLKKAIKKPDYMLKACYFDLVKISSTSAGEMTKLCPYLNMEEYFKVSFDKLTDRIFPCSDYAAKAIKMIQQISYGLDKIRGV